MSAGLLVSQGVRGLRWCHVKRRWRYVRYIANCRSSLVCVSHETPSCTRCPLAKTRIGPALQQNGGTASVLPLRIVPVQGFTTNTVVSGLGFELRGRVAEVQPVVDRCR